MSVEMVHQGFDVLLTSVAVLINTFGMFRSVQTRPILLNSDIASLK
jgi:hypothetical protein